MHSQNATSSRKQYFSALDPNFAFDLLVELSKAFRRADDNNSQVKVYLFINICKLTNWVTHYCVLEDVNLIRRSLLNASEFLENLEEVTGSR